MENLYGTIDLTKLGNVVRQHPELVRNVQFKDGTTHKMLNININQKQQTDQYGNVAFMKVGVKREEERQGVNYYLGDLKVSQYGNNVQQQATVAPQPQQPTKQEENLPF